MILSFLIRAAQLLALLAAQVLVFNHIHFHGYGTPVVCPVLLLYMPKNTSRTALLLWAFAMGFLADLFSGTPGVCGGAMTLTAMTFPPLLALTGPRDAAETLVPTYGSMGVGHHVFLVMSLLFVFHAAYFALEFFSFFNIVDTLLYMLAGWVSSVVVALALEGLRSGRSVG